MSDLKSMLIGSWALVSFVASRVTSSNSDGKDVIHPMTEEAAGIIMYTLDSHMSAQLMVPGARRFAVADVLAGSTKEWAEAGSHYLAYSGPFSVEEENEGEPTVKHTMQVCSFPNWIGAIQTRRIVRLEEGKTLVLSTDGPITIGGEQRIAVLTWRKL